MAPDLPESYYLDNVTTLFDHVENVYADILEAEQLAFLTEFRSLTEDSQKLYIRLLNRSSLW
ncbi:MAG: VRR-NUC domain-containing protein, partial [Gammaproteobacteria bacterium]|nr:VRR-NUC domain-containing protein [Gammaproteobacteria bacterium]